MTGVGVEWGLQGALNYAPSVDAIVVVDVLSFSTSVTVAVGRGAQVWPHPGGPGARQLADEIDGLLAGRRTLTTARRCRRPRCSTCPPARGSSCRRPTAGRSRIPLRRNRVGSLPGRCATPRRSVATWPRSLTIETVVIVPAGERWPTTRCGWPTRTWSAPGAIIARMMAVDPVVALLGRGGGGARGVRAAAADRGHAVGAGAGRAGLRRRRAAGVLGRRLDGGAGAASTGVSSRPEPAARRARAGDSGRESNGATSDRRAEASWSRAAGSSRSSRARSRSSRSAIAASTCSWPAWVRLTTTPRRSAGSGLRARKPRCSSRSIRLVIVPLVTSVWVTSRPGESAYGAPARRSALSTSNSQVSRPCSANAARRARSRWRARRLTRESTCSGATSRSGRSRDQAPTIRSTSSCPSLVATGKSSEHQVS